MNTDTDDRAAAPEAAARVRLRDAALRRTRAVIVGVTAAAVALTGLFSVVAAQAFKGHQQAATPTARSTDDGTSATAPATEDPAPLRPPATPPAASDPQPSSPAPEPQVSGGS